MAVVNVTPVLDAFGGATTTPARFTAVAMRAGRTAVRVNSGTVTFPTQLVAEWDGSAWDTAPQLHALPIDCYWAVRVTAPGVRLDRTVILPDTGDQVDFGDLIPVTPDTAQVDSSALTQFQATQQYVSNQVAHIDETAATIFGLVATIQAQIDTASAASTSAAASAATAQASIAELAADLAVVTSSSAAAQTAAQDAADSAAAAAAAQTAAETAATAAAGSAASAANNATTIDGNA